MENITIIAIITLFQGMKVLVDAQRKLNIPLSDKNNESLGDQLLLDKRNYINNIFFPQYKTLLSILWSDKGIQATYERRNEFQLVDSVQYFLDNLERIADPDYVPTLQDILFCRKTTKEVVETRIDIKHKTNSVPFLFVDVGGQRTHRQKWFQCFESVNSIFFIASTSEYDQVLMEDKRTNRLQESRNVFDTIINNKIFEKIAVILFLNKVDLLERKICKGNIHHYFPEFENVSNVIKNCPGFTGNPKSLDDVKKFILSYFLSAVRTKRHFYHHFTVAVDTNNIKIVFLDVKDIAMNKNLEEKLLL